MAANATLERVWRIARAVLADLHHDRRPGADRRQIADAHLPVLDALRATRPRAGVVEVLQRPLRQRRRDAQHWATGRWPTSDRDAPGAVQRSA